MPKKVSILIDGSNFYFKLKAIGLRDQLKFDFATFCKHLAGSNTLVSCTYYIGAVRTDGTSKMLVHHAQQQKLFTHLLANNVHYELGYLLKSGGKMHEKGVDVRMAVDLLTQTYENKADYFIVISSDTDLIPAIKQVRQKNKVVEYVGFSKQPSVALVASCNRARLLAKGDLKPFVQ